MIYFFTCFFHYIVSSSLKEDNLVKNNGNELDNNFSSSNAESIVQTNDKNEKKSEDELGIRENSKFEYESLYEKVNEILNNSKYKSNNCLYSKTKHDSAEFGDNKEEETNDQKYEKENTFNTSKNIFSNKVKLNQDKFIEKEDKNLNEKSLECEYLNDQKRSPILSKKPDEAFHTLLYHKIDKKPQKIKKKVSFSSEVEHFEWDSQMQNLDDYFDNKSIKKQNCGKICSSDSKKISKFRECENLSSPKNYIEKLSINAIDSFNAIQRKVGFNKEKDIIDSESLFSEDLTSELENTMKTKSKETNINFRLESKNEEQTNIANRVGKLNKNEVSFTKTLFRSRIPKNKYLDTDIKESDISIHFRKNKEDFAKEDNVESGKINIDSDNQSIEFLNPNNNNLKGKIEDNVISKGDINTLTSTNITYNNVKALINAKIDIIKFLNEFFKNNKNDSDSLNHDLINFNKDKITLFKIIGSYDDDVVSVTVNKNEMKAFVIGKLNFIHIEFPIDIFNYTKKGKLESSSLVDKIFCIISITWPKYNLMLKKTC